MNTLEACAARAVVGSERRLTVSHGTKGRLGGLHQELVVQKEESKTRILA